MGVSFKGNTFQQTPGIRRIGRLHVGKGGDAASGCSQASLRLLRQFQPRARRFTEAVDSIKAVLLKDWGQHNNGINTDPKGRLSLSLGLLAE